MKRATQPKGSHSAAARCDSAQGDVVKRGGSFPENSGRSPRNQLNERAGESGSETDTQLKKNVKDVTLCKATWRGELAKDSQIFHGSVGAKKRRRTQIKSNA